MRGPWDSLKYMIKNALGNTSNTYRAGQNNTSYGILGGVIVGIILGFSGGPLGSMLGAFVGGAVGMAFSYMLSG